MDYGYKDGKYIGEQVSPLIVARAAQDYFDQMMNHNISAETYFNNTINWLLNNRKVVQYSSNVSIEMTHWYYNFSIWGLPSGFYGGMFEAEILHTFAIAYNYTNNASYLNLCNQIINGFEIPISMNGNTYVLDSNSSWYPEYAVPPSIDSEYKPKFVLNGFLFALEDFHLTNRILNQSRLEIIFNKGINAAIENLYKYDDSVNNWTYYQLDPIRYAPENYHQIHINLVRSLYQISNKSTFNDYFIKWSTYTEFPSEGFFESINIRYVIYGFPAFLIILVLIIGIDFIQVKIRKKRLDS